ncbi:MAG: glycosyltransferase family 87 protein [Sphingobacteriaceae bacterium]
MKSQSISITNKRERIAQLVWLLITLFCAIQSLISHRYNNYLIFENTFRNLLEQRSLYALYPSLHADSNHYGPVFSLFISPFAVLPNALGLILWDVFNYFILYKAIKSIPVTKHWLIYLVAIPCLVSSMLSEQFNPTAAALILFSYTFLNKNNGFWSAFFIILGTLIKLYGIVGLGFFFFVKNKKQFIAYLAFWTLILFILPMAFSSVDFVLRSYQEWFISLSHKNESNLIAATQDLSIMGFIRKLLNNPYLPNTVFLVLGCLTFSFPYFNFKAFKWPKFRLYIVSSVLLFPVLFSTGAEDCTYIIAIIGVGIWYLLSEQRLWEKLLLATTVLFSCNLPMLLFPKISHEYPMLITMLCVPFFIVWLLIIYQATNLKEGDLRLGILQNSDNTNEQKTA